MVGMNEYMRLIGTMELLEGQDTIVKVVQTERFLPEDIQEAFN